MIISTNIVSNSSLVQNWIGPSVAVMIWMHNHLLKNTGSLFTLLKIKQMNFSSSLCYKTTYIKFSFQKKKKRKKKEKKLLVKQYFSYQVLGISSGIEEPGGLRWDLALFLLIAWSICYLCIFKGVRWTGKVHFTKLNSGISFFKCNNWLYNAIC